MVAIRTIEDIEVWRQARKLAADMYRLTSSGAFARDCGLRDQMRRAGVSIASNIAEGFARESNIEFRRFLSIARGSVAELKTQMYIASDIGYIDGDALDAINSHIDQVGRMISSFMDYLNRNPSRPRNISLPSATTSHETMNHEP
jgi:four helix bundle protein